MATVQLDNIINECRVLTEAVGRVATLWKLTNDQLGAILGLSPATASRLRSGSFALEPASKPFELGQYLVRLFRSLDAIMASDDAASISWLQNTIPLPAPAPVAPASSTPPPSPSALEFESLVPRRTAAA